MLTRAAKEPYAIETYEANGGWNSSDWVQRADCVWRRVVAAAGEEVKNAIANGTKRIVLNLGEVSYIDSGGLGTLVALHTTARSAGGTIKLASLTKRVGDLLQVTKLLTVFEVNGSEFEALEAFRTAA